MLIVGPFAGRAVARFGPRPMLFLASIAMATGLTLFIVNRATPIDLSIDLVFSLVGIVCIIIPIVNMISLSLPRETIGVGLGFNTMLRNLGGAVGPVVATAIMATYTSPLTAVFNGNKVVEQLPNSTAFDIVFGVGLVLTAVVIILSSLSKNYTFRNMAQAPAKPQA